MIWRARFPRRPPAGRIDGIMYYGGVRTMADLLFYAADLDTNQQVVVPQSAMPPAPPNGAAGGGLSGTYPNPTVAAVPDSALSANVPVLVAGVYPAGDGQNLTNLPPVDLGKVGTCFGGTGTLVGMGACSLVAGVDFPNPVGGGVSAFVVCIGVNATGILTVSTGGVGPGDTVTVTSSAGMSDSGTFFVFHVAYVS